MKVEKWKRPNGDIQIEVTLWNNGYVITVNEALKLMELIQNALTGYPLEEDQEEMNGRNI